VISVIPGIRSLRTPPSLAAIFLLSLLAISIPAVAQSSIFSNQNSPNPNTQGNTLNAVAALSPSDAWAVGYKNDNNLNDSRTLTLHWDGTTWKTVASPNPGSIPSCQNGNTGNVLTAVAPVSTSDVWAVGFSFTCTALLKPMVLHWDGTAWKTVQTPKVRTNDNSALTSIVALASNNVYAVGYQPASNGAVLTLVEHWNGTAWNVMSSPNANNTGNVLAGISANSPTDIWAVGDQVAPGIPAKTLVEHFNGTKWSVVPSPNVLNTGDLNQNVLTSVQAVSGADITAAGFVLDSSNQRELTLIEHWDGTAWSIIPSPNQSSTAGSLNTLHGVTAVSGTDLYAAGFFADAASSGQQQTFILHFDGSAWSIIPSPTSGLAQQLNGIFALPGTTNVWSVGSFSTNGTDPETGLLIVPLTLVMFSPIG
jgi:hypothetical protein